MKSRFTFGICVALIEHAILLPAAAMELIHSPDTGHGTSSGAGGMTVNRTCRECIFDADPDTYWEVIGNSLGVHHPASMSMAASASFQQPAEVDSITVHFELEATVTANSNLLTEGSFAIQYRRFGTMNDVILSSYSYGPIGGNSPATLEFNDTLTGLDLSNIQRLRIVGEANTFNGDGLASIRMRMFHWEATGRLVPEPASALLLAVSICTLMLRRDRSHGFWSVRWSLARGTARIQRYRASEN